MLRWLTFAVAVVLAVTGQVWGAAEFWLSGTTSAPASPFPTSSTTVPEFTPRTGASQTFYIWGRPDTGEELINLSLNVVVETPSCTPPACASSAIAFTGATVYNDPFPSGAPMPVRRFEFTDNSINDPICRPNIYGICGLDGATVFNDTGPSAVGIRSGTPTDPLYSAANGGWLIAEIDYDVLLTGAHTTTRLFLEIGPNGMTYDDESTGTVFAVLGHMGDTAFNADTQRNTHSSNFDAVIRPWRLQGDFDGNGTVAPADETLWRTNFGSTTLLAADHSGNSILDAADYVVWRKFLGISVGAGGATSIPEPSTAVAMFIALTTIWTLCRPLSNRAK